MKEVWVYADMLVNISAPVEGEFKDWPPMLQDRVYKEVEVRGLAKGWKYEHVRSRAGINEGVAYIHIVMRRKVTLQ